MMICESNCVVIWKQKDLKFTFEFGCTLCLAFGAGGTTKNTIPARFYPAKRPTAVGKTHWVIPLTCPNQGQWLKLLSRNVTKVLTTVPSLGTSSSVQVEI